MTDLGNILSLVFEIDDRSMQYIASGIVDISMEYIAFFITKNLGNILFIALMTDLYHPLSLLYDRSIQSIVLANCQYYVIYFLWY